MRISTQSGVNWAKFDSASYTLSRGFKIKTIFDACLTSLIYVSDKQGDR